MVDFEWHRFKSDISLLHYAIDRYGYARDRRESSRASHVLRHLKTDDKIIVRRDADGHWTYFSVRDDRDHGTIVDFVQHREPASSLGEIRQELRHWLGCARPDSDLTPYAPPPGAPVLPSPKVAEAFAAARIVRSHAYLAERGIPTETPADPRFEDTWRQDARGNVLFAHRDDAGELTGFEVKNGGFTGFSPGGTKSVWQSLARTEDRFCVVTESAIDGLSHHALHPDECAASRYLSTAGAPSPRQGSLLGRLFAALPVPTVVVVATDADAAGDALADKLTALASPYPYLHVRRDRPALGKDWNDALQRLARQRQG